MAFCAKCGNQMTDDLKFCPACGTPVEGAFAPTAQPTPMGQPPYEQPGGQPQYGQPQYGQPQYEQPAGQPQFGQAPGQPGGPQPQYGQPGPQPGGPQPIYGQPFQAQQPTDAQANKGMAILAYILPLIPILTGNHQKSPFVKFHTNQAINIWIFYIAWSVVSTLLRSLIRVHEVTWLGEISYTPGWVSIIVWLGYAAVTIFTVIGIINANGGKTEKLPVIGGLLTVFK